jgi:TrmH family RNA methyltransferase
LTTKKGRRASGQFMAEGVRVLEQALEHEILPDRLYYADDLLTDRGAKLVERIRALSVAAIPAGSRDLGRIGDAVTAPGLLAVFRTPSQDLAELYRPDMRSILLCDSIADTGNLGTLIRSAAAFGFDLLLLAEQCAEPFAPKVVRASAGAVFARPIAVVSMADALAFIAREQIALVAADLRGEDHMSRMTGRLRGRPLALALGSEAHGLSDVLINRADHRVRVRHEACVESLNAAIAGSILMKEWYDGRARRKQ